MGLIHRRILSALTVLSLACLVACSGPPVVEAQTSGGGLARCVVDGTTMAGKCTQGDPLRSLVTMSTGIFGDGTDGACNFDGTSTVLGLAPATGTSYNLDPPLDAYEIYIMSRDIYCSTIVISSGVDVATEDNRVIASTSITLNGNARLSAEGCSGWAGGGAFTGEGGCQAVAGTIPTAGGVGGSGNTGAGGGAANGAGPVPRGYAGSSGAGGAGAAAGGGAGAAGATFTASQGDLHTLAQAMAGRTAPGIAIGTTVAPGGGGGGGDNGTHHGGGGGGGGGYLVVAAPIIITNSTSKLTSEGGKGGAGATGGGATGGGGGGMGGIAVVVIGGGTQPTITVAGGVGGIGGSGGASGGAGHAGLVDGPGGLAWVVGVQ